MTNYTEEVFDAVGDNAEWINYVAPIIGVDPVNIAAALAEEIYLRSPALVKLGIF